MWQVSEGEGGKLDRLSSTWFYFWKIYTYILSLPTLFFDDFKLILASNPFPPPLNLLFAMRLKKLSPALSFTRFPPHSLSFHCEIVSRPLLIFWFSNQIKTKNNTFDWKFWMRFLSFIMKFPLSNFNFKSLGSGVMGSHLQLHKFST